MLSLSGRLIQAPNDVVIDASVWISTILLRDSNHSAALTWVNQHLLGGGSLVAPLLLVTETASAVSRITGNPLRGHQAATQLYSMPEMRLVQMDQDLVDEATDLAADLRLRGADSYYVAVAKLLALQLVTFDSEQLSRTAPVIATIRP
jgi:predicted nucleic acid-binding protein